MLPALVAGEAAFAAGASSFALFDPTENTGFLGWGDVALSLGKLVVRVETRSHLSDASALDEMITIARGLVAVDTGLLLSGITGEDLGDGFFEFRASAVRETASGKESADYARYVEFGTRAGEAGVFAPITAHEGFFASDQRWSLGARGAAVEKRRRSRRTHGGTQPRPFFFPAANQVLARREQSMAALPYDAASEDGWEMA